RLLSAPISVRCARARGSASTSSAAAKGRLPPSICGRHESGRRGRFGRPRRSSFTARKRRPGKRVAEDPRATSGDGRPAAREPSQQRGTPVDGREREAEIGGIRRPGSGDPGNRRSLRRQAQGDGGTQGGDGQSLKNVTGKARLQGEIEIRQNA